MAIAEEPNPPPDDVPPAAGATSPDSSRVDVPPPVPAAPPDLLAVAGFDPTATPPRAWVEGFLRDAMGDLSNAAPATEEFLGMYDRLSDRRPRLAALATGSRRDQEAFVLVVATLVEELEHVTKKRFEQLMGVAGGMRRTHAVAVNALLDGAVAWVRKHGRTVPAPYVAHIERHILELKLTVPEGKRGRRVTPVDTLTHALAFALRHVDGLSDLDRWRLIAHVMGGKKTPTQVRRLVSDRTRRREGYLAPSCAASLVPAIAVATPVAALLTACGRLAPIAPHGACGPPVPGLSVGAFHVLDAPTVERADAQRAGEVRGLLEHGLFPLPVRDGGNG